MNGAAGISALDGVCFGVRARMKDWKGNWRLYLVQRKMNEIIFAGSLKTNFS